MASFFKGLASKIGRMAPKSPRENVGGDRAGNVYYYLHEEGRAPRRMVEYKEAIPDPNTVPTIWWSWMASTREHPPTTEELRNEELKSAAMTERVRKLEEADHKLRMQEISNRMHGSSAPEASLDSFMQNMEKKRP